MASWLPTAQFWKVSDGQPFAGTPGEDLVAEASPPFVSLPFSTPLTCFSNHAMRSPLQTPSTRKKCPAALRQLVLSQSTRSGWYVTGLFRDAGDSSDRLT